MLYWANLASYTPGAGAIMSYALSACPNDLRPAAPNLTSPYALRFAGGALYWTTDGTQAQSHSDGVVQTLSLPAVDGGAVATLTPATLSRASDVVVTAGQIAWTQQGVPNLYQSEGGVFVCPATGCTGAPTMLASGTVQNPLYRAFGIASDGARLYWTVLGSLGAAYADGAIYSCPLSGCAGNITVTATDQHAATSMVVVGTTLYWTTTGTAPTNTDGKVMKCALANCEGTKVTLASSRLYAFRLAVDATDVYFTELRGANVVSRVPINGGPVATIYRGPSPSYGIAVDDKYIYFSTFGAAASDGKVLRIAK